MPDETHISIVVITYRRPDLCRRSLESVLAAMDRSSAMKYEVLVGVNGKDDETQSLLLEMKNSFSEYSLHVFSFDPPMLPGACRNQLVAQAKGEWIYFLDDDAYVASDLFMKWRNCRLKHECAAVGGPNLNPPSSNFFQKAASQALASPFATYFSSSRYRPHGSPRLCSEASLILCHLFVRRNALSESPFLNSLICAEENWLLQNLKSQRHQLGYDPELFVWHERRPNLKTFVRQVFKYGYGRGQIFRRRSSGLTLFHLLPSLCLFYTLLTAVLMISSEIISAGMFLPFLTYATLCFYFAWSGSLEGITWKQKLSTALIFPVIHVSYGWGLLRGFFAWPPASAQRRGRPSPAAKF